MNKLLTVQKNQILTRLELAKLSSHLGKEPWQSVSNQAYNDSSNTSISVIITLYNYSEYIGECLSSVSASETDNIPNAFEVIVIDDCSTDNSANLVEEYINKSDIPTLLIKKKFNTGLADARNVGLSLARSNYIFILDADNWIYPNCLSILYNEISTSVYASVYGIINRFDNQTQESVGQFSEREWNVRELVKNPYIDAMAMFNKDVVIKIGGYSTELMAIGWSGWEDYDLWLKLAQAGYSCKLVPQILSAYRTHSQSMINITKQYILLLATHFTKKFSKLLNQHADLETVFGFSRSSLIDGDNTATYEPELVAKSLLDANQSELQQTQAQLQQTQAQLQQTQIELQQTQIELQQTQIELQQTQIELQQTQIELQQTQAELMQSQSGFKQTQVELERLQSQLRANRLKSERLQTIIAAMHTSKFWQLRTLWLKFKLYLGLTNKENEIVSNIKDALKLQPLDSSISASNNIMPVGDSYKQALSLTYMNNLKSFLASGCKLVLPTHTQSILTVILILHNRAELTFQCLRSLTENFSELLEIIIVDNASSDETTILLDRLEGAKIIRNLENMHFLLASNQAAREAQGKYILFLNNDAQVLPGSIPSAVRTIESSDNIGAVGGKIILLNGTLQEAGSIVWNDGCCQGYGRGDNPFAPMYMFMRDVNYCSGAFLLTKREIFVQMGGFDTDYKPAYYEETDYCLRLWQTGKRVVYDPDAVILHFEFASSTSSQSALQLQATNREVFLTKHFNTLRSHHQPQESSILLARSADKCARRVLFIEDRVPHSFLGTGYPRAKEILLGLLELGYFVTIYPLIVYQEDWDSVYQSIPKVVEVMTDYGPANLEEFLQQRKGYYDIILISRPHNMQVLQPILLKNPELFSNTKIVYDAEAIFSLREVAKRELKGEKVHQSEIDALLSNEFKLLTGVNCVISVSEAESDKFRQHGFSKVRTLGHSIGVKPTENNFENRSNILFVGAIQGDLSPNTDAVFWFVKEIFLKIRNKLHLDLKLLIVGSNNSGKIINLANDSVKIIGRVEDLNDYYNQARIFIAPTRFAAGIPIKVYDAASHGLPIVSTSLIASQVGWQDGVDLLVADDASSFAERCVELYTDSELWEKLRNNALNRVKKECSKESFITKLKDILEIENL